MSWGLFSMKTPMSWLKLNDQFLPDNKGGTVGQPLVLTVEELRREHAVPGGRDDEVDVCRAEGMAVELGEECAGGFVAGDPVRYGVGGSRGCIVHPGLS